MTAHAPPRSVSWLRRIGAALLRGAEARPLAALTLLVALQTALTLQAKDVWVPDEVRHAAVLRALVEHGDWLVLSLGGEIYPDKPPLYFWFVALLEAVRGDTDPPLFMLAAAISGWLLIATLVVVGRHALALGRIPVLVAGGMLLSSWFFVERLHQPRMDLLFAVFILAAHGAFYRGVLKPGAPSAGWIATGAVAGALATLTKGPLGLALPLGGLLLYLLWQRRARLLVSRPVMTGLAAGLAVLAAYLVAVWAVSGPSALRLLLVDQTLQRAIDAPRLSGPVWFYAPVLLTAFLPWSLALLALPGRDSLAALRRGLRRGDATAGPAPVAYLAAVLLGDLLLLSAIDYKNAFFLVPVMAPAALLAAVLFARAGPPAGRRARGVVVAVLLVAGIAMPFVPDWTEWPDAVRGEAVMAVALLLAGVAALAAARLAASGFVLVVALVMSLAALPFYRITISGLDTVMAPRPLAAALAAAARSGHAVAQFHPYQGNWFDYHSGLAIPALHRGEEAAAFLSAARCSALALRRRDLARLPPRPEPHEVLAEQRLNGIDWLVAAWGPCDPPGPGTNRQK